MKGGSSSSSSRKRSEQPPPIEEEEEEEEDDNKMYEVEEDEEDPAEDEEEEENNPQEEEEEEEEEEQRPKLAEGFFEIEAVRGKRTRKGKRQYLIKWRGWPETANTWEPFDNLQSCSDIIQAFEQRSAKTSRKRKRKHTTTPTSTSSQTPPPKKKQQPQPDRNTDPVETPDTTHYPPLQPADDAATLYHLTHNSFTDFHIPLEQTNQPDPLFSKLTGPPPPPTLLDNANISVQVPHTAPDQSKPETSPRFIGAKRRKSGRVRRFKQDSLPPALHDTRPSIPQITNTPTSLLLEPFANDARDVDCFENPSAIIKIIKPIGYSTSLSNDVHDVSLIFRAIRSDGGETEVDNNYLKVHNPLLLISYYEQHLRYTPPPT